MEKLKPELVSQLFVLLLIGFLLVLIFKEMAPYLSGVLGAITLYVILKNSMSKLANKGWNKDLAAGLLMLASFVGILVPILAIVLLLSSKVSVVVENSDKVLSAIKQELDEVEYYLNYDLSGSIDSRSITTWISSNLQDLVGGTFNAFIAIGIMYFMLYFMLVHRKQFKKLMLDYIPMERVDLQRIGKESDKLVKATALGIPLVAIIQGIIALIGYLIFDAPNPFFWFAITTIGSVVPFIGAALGFIPLAILMITQGQNWQGIAILIYGMAVVGVTDNLVRLYILRRLDNVHPLITLFGVIVGVPLFGFIGLIFGPLLISLFLLIIKIYKKEYGKPEVEVE
ncbi:MAG TPA: AI-2E family transporter [Salinimicrobium sp.]|nr:AI-2E family transporter [Salinimicrobium sp.]